MSLGGNSPSGSTTTTTNSSPWSQQQPFLAGTSNPNLSSISGSAPSVFQSAAQLYSNPSDYPQLYPGSTTGSQVSPLNSTETSALSALTNNGMNSSLMNSDANMQQYILNGGMLSSGNPYQSAELSALNSQVTPQLESQFTQGNATDNPNVAFALGQGMGTADANLLGTNYNNAMNQLTQTSLYAPSTYSGQLSGENTALAAGQTQQNQAQNVLSSEINAYNYGQQLPYNMLDQYGQMISGNYGGTSATTSPYFEPSTASNILTAGLGLGSLATPGSSGTSALGNMGTAALSAASKV